MRDDNDEQPARPTNVDDGDEEGRKDRSVPPPSMMVLAALQHPLQKLRQRRRVPGRRKGRLKEIRA